MIIFLIRLRDFRNDLLKHWEEEKEQQEEKNKIYNTLNKTLK